MRVRGGASRTAARDGGEDSGRDERCQARRSQRIREAPIETLTIASAPHRLAASHARRTAARERGGRAEPRRRAAAREVPIGAFATSRGIDVRGVDMSAIGRHIAARGSANL
jgi:hypothetical protein